MLASAPPQCAFFHRSGHGDGVLLPGSAPNSSLPCPPPGWTELPWRCVAGRAAPHHPRRPRVGGALPAAAVPRLHYGGRAWCIFMPINHMQASSCPPITCKHLHANPITCKHLHANPITCKHLHLACWQLRRFVLYFCPGPHSSLLGAPLHPSLNHMLTLIMVASSWHCYAALLCGTVTPHCDTALFYQVLTALAPGSMEQVLKQPRPAVANS